MTQLATEEALVQLGAALTALTGLSDTLRTGEKLTPEEQRKLERSLLRFRAELRSAGVLAERGLAHCREWADLLVPPATYQPNGVYAAATTPQAHELSIEA